ncbi:divergent RING-finger protein [Carp edema virus]|nr:divergent RING-finger protein [Carp edema virus]
MASLDVTAVEMQTTYSSMLDDKEIVLLFDVIKPNTEYDEYIQDSLVLLQNTRFLYKIDYEDFLNSKPKSVECMVCYDDVENYFKCYNCECGICHPCLFTSLEYQTAWQNKCPNCLEDITLLDFGDLVKSVEIPQDLTFPELLRWTGTQSEFPRNLNLALMENIVCNQLIRRKNHIYKQKFADIRLKIVKEKNRKRIIKIIDSIKVYLEILNRIIDDPDIFVKALYPQNSIYKILAGCIIPYNAFEADNIIKHPEDCFGFVKAVLFNKLNFKELDLEYQNYYIYATKYIVHHFIRNKEKSLIYKFLDASGSIFAKILERKTPIQEILVSKRAVIKRVCPNPTCSGIIKHDDKFCLMCASEICPNCNVCITTNKMEQIVDLDLDFVELNLDSTKHSDFVKMNDLLVSSDPDLCKKIFLKFEEILTFFFGKINLIRENKHDLNRFNKLFRDAPILENIQNADASDKSLTFEIEDLKSRLASLIDLDVSPDQFTNITNPAESNHTCKKKDIEDFKKYVTSFRLCPNCNITIEKKTGCDVMFCINCKTSFDWTTSSVNLTNLHNPEYEDWIKQKTNNKSKLTLDFADIDIHNHKIALEYYNNRFVIDYTNFKTEFLNPIVQIPIIADEACKFYLDDLRKFINKIYETYGNLLKMYKILKVDFQNKDATLSKMIEDYFDDLIARKKINKQTECSKITTAAIEVEIMKAHLLTLSKLVYYFIRFIVKLQFLMSDNSSNFAVVLAFPNVFLMFVKNGLLKYVLTEHSNLNKVSFIYKDFAIKNSSVSSITDVLRFIEHYIKLSSAWS